MSDQFAPWITDPDDPADIPTASDDAAANVAAAYPELVDKSRDGAFSALVDAAGPEPSTMDIVQTFMQAIDVLDQTEPGIRDLIESRLMDIAGINRSKVKDARLACDALTREIASIRTAAIKTAFRHLRDTLPSYPSEVQTTGEVEGTQPVATDNAIHGHPLASWAKAINDQDINRIYTAISVGLSAGEDNTDIAHRVIGSRRNNGIEGATEVTRQHVLRLGKGFLQRRKRRMGGTRPDVRAG